MMLVLLCTGSGIIDLGLASSESKEHTLSPQGQGHGPKQSHANHGNNGQGKDSSKQAGSGANNVDTRGGQLCSFLFTASGCSKGDTCTYLHADIGRASRSDKERAKKALERMNRSDINYDALK